MLHCAVDTVRRIEFDELPYSRVGKRNLYLLDDVLKLVRARQSVAMSSEHHALEADVINSLADDVRERSQR